MSSEKTDLPSRTVEEAMLKLVTLGPKKPLNVKAARGAIDSMDEIVSLGMKAIGLKQKIKQALLMRFLKELYPDKDLRVVYIGYESCTSLDIYVGTPVGGRRPMRVSELKDKYGISLRHPGLRARAVVERQKGIQVLFECKEFKTIFYELATTGEDALKLFVNPKEQA